MAELAFVVYPHPMGMLKLDEIRAKADAAFPDILKMATQWKPTGAKLAAAKPVYPAEVIDFEGTEADVNDLFFKNGWSLGVPVIPPTPERVAAMLKGTSHKPDEVIGLIPPRVAAVTVELVATHAVMAGCEPEQLPILLAVASTLASEDFRSSTTTMVAREFRRALGLRLVGGRRDRPGDGSSCVPIRAVGSGKGPAKNGGGIFPVEQLSGRVIYMQIIHQFFGLSDPK